MSVSSSEPLDLIKLCLDEEIYVKLRGNRDFVGKLHAYDSHCNMVLGNAIETVHTVNEETGEHEKTQNSSDLIFIRGDLVMIVTDASNV